MGKKRNIISNKYLFWVVLGLIILVSYFILQDFLVSFITAAILAFLLKPVQDFLSKKIPKKYQHY